MAASNYLNVNNSAEITGVEPSLYAGLYPAARPLVDSYRINSSSNFDCGDDDVSRVCEGPAPEEGYGMYLTEGPERGRSQRPLTHVGNK